MLQHLDAHAREVVQVAQTIAREFQLDYVGTEHILLAILRTQEGLGARTLKALKVTEPQMRREIEKVLEKDMEDTWVFGRLPGSPHFRNVMVLAQDEAAQLEAKEIGSEHLLLALLRENGSTAQRALARLGISLEKCREEVLRQAAA